MLKFFYIISMIKTARTRKRNTVCRDISYQSMSVSFAQRQGRIINDLTC